jgi:hypothetical protein
MAKKPIMARAWLVMKTLEQQVLYHYEINRYHYHQTLQM